MARKPNRSKFVEPAIPAKAIVTSFFLDWLFWGYFAYVVVYLLNYYWYTVYVDWYGKLVLPAWAWPVAVGGTFELAALCHALGHSLGVKALGLRWERTGPGVKLLHLLSLNGALLLGAGAFALVYFGACRIHGLPPALGREAAMGLGAVLGLVVVLGAMVFFSQAVPGLVLAPLPSPDKWTAPPPRWYRTLWGLMALGLFLLIMILGWHVTDASLKRLGNMVKTAYLWKALATPDFQHLLHPDPWLNQSILQGLIQSIFMALLATVFGAAFAFPLSFLGARNIMNFNPLARVAYYFTRGVFNVFRSVESMLWATIFAIWIGWGPFAGTVALFIHTIAALGKLYSEQVEHIDPGPVEAVTATGASRLEVVRYAVIPQIVPSCLALTFYRWDINVRMSTVIGLVGGGGIGRVLFYYKQNTMWHQVGAVILTIALVVWALDYISGRVREGIV